jgi:hypothetical protein
MELQQKVFTGTALSESRKRWFGGTNSGGGSWYSDDEKIIQLPIGYTWLGQKVEDRSGV